MRLRPGLHLELVLHLWPRLRLAAQSVLSLLAPTLLGPLGSLQLEEETGLR